MGRLFWKFFCAILLAQLAATVGIGGVFWLRDQAREREHEASIDTSPPAETRIDAAAATLRYGGSAALRELITESRHRSVFAVDERGQELLSRPYKPEMTAQAEQVLATEGARHVVRRVQADGHTYLIFLPSAHRGHGIGGGRGPDGPPPDGGGPPPEVSFRPLALMAIATLASLLFAALLAWYFSRPIRALRSAFEAAAEGDLAPRFGEARAGGDELSDLGRDFDRMSTQLRMLMDGQRRLLHDVSHELRSPLARLQAAIGLAHQQPDKIAPSLERIERESVRMDKLVGELLTLSRLEADAPMPMNEEINVADMIGEIAEDAQFESGRQIAITGKVVATIKGAPDLLWRAIENVVRNAVKHGMEGDTVEVNMQVDADTVQIRMLDRGPGVSENDLEAIFEPFFRSNALSNNIDGHGLGLAIARRVILAHGGKITASNRAGGGLCMEILLPRSA
ncbi:MAG: ATP-binding protein [Pseudomonadota bacterium]